MKKNQKKTDGWQGADPRMVKVADEMRAALRKQKAIGSADAIRKVMN